MNLEPPFFATNFPALLNKILNGDLPTLNEKYSPELRQFVKGLLIREVDKRPSINDILQSDFIALNLIKNREEFNTLIRSNKSSKLKISEKGMKSDLKTLKTYRFS